MPRILDDFKRAYIDMMGDTDNNPFDVDPPKPKDTSLYGLLNIPRNADARRIKAAFYALAKKCHPDMGGDADEFIRLKKAYDILVNSQARKRYDKSLALLEKKKETGLGYGSFSGSMGFQIFPGNPSSPSVPLYHAAPYSQSKKVNLGGGGIKLYAPKPAATITISWDYDPIQGVPGFYRAGDFVMIDYAAQDPRQVLSSAASHPNKAMGQIKDVRHTGYSNVEIVVEVF